LDRVQVQGGIFILIDEVKNPPYREQLANYLESKGAYYFSAYGVPDGNLCEKNSDCIQALITYARPVQHIITYQSRSFPENLPHELVVKFSREDGTSSISASTSFSFGTTKATSSIKPNIRIVNSILVVSAPFFLMLILVLSVQPRESKV